MLAVLIKVCGSRDGNKKQKSTAVVYCNVAYNLQLESYVHTKVRKYIERNRNIDIHCIGIEERERERREGAVSQTDARLAFYDVRPFPFAKIRPPNPRTPPTRNVNAMGAY